MLKTLVIVGSNSLHTHRYINNISKYCENIYFITSTEGTFDAPENLRDCIVMNLRVKNFSVKKQLRDCIIKINPDLIHIHQATSHAFHTARANKGLPYKILLSLWGSDILVNTKNNILLRKMVKYTLNNSDLVIGTSLHMIRETSKLIKNDKTILDIAYLGIEDDLIATNIDINKKENIIFSSRSLKKLYRTDKIIIAFSKLIKDKAYSDWKLIIAGKGPELDNLKQLTIDLNINNQVTFTGFINTTKLKEYYSLSKILVNIPTSDAAGGSIFEAMGNGGIPVLSNIPSNTEWILNNITGIVSPNINILEDDIKKAIKMTEDKEQYNKIYQLNKEIVTSVLMSTCTERYFNIYKSLLNNS